MEQGQVDPRLIVVGGYPPNEAFGGGLVLKGLLCEYPADRMVVVTNANVLRSLRARSDGGGLLGVPHVGIEPFRTDRRGLRRLMRAANLLKVFPAARAVLTLARPGTVLLAHPWGGELGSELLTAAYVAGRISGAPLVLYELDEWGASVAKSGRPARVLETVFHGPLARAAASVWVMSEPLARRLTKRYGIEAGVLPHSVDISRYNTLPRRQATSEFHVLYTGSIYSAQADAIANVAKAVAATRIASRLVLHTPEDPVLLSTLGIVGDRVSIRPTVAPSEIPKLLSTAGALLLPFSFSQEAREVVSTSFPTKTADYLASGIPILVHAPPYATISRMATEEGWGWTVTEASVEALVQSIELLAHDTELRERLVSRALAIARDRHDIEDRRSDLRSSLRAASVHTQRAKRT